MKLCIFLLIRGVWEYNNNYFLSIFYLKIYQIIFFIFLNIIFYISSFQNNLKILKKYNLKYFFNFFFKNTSKKQKQIVHKWHTWQNLNFVIRIEWKIMKDGKPRTWDNPKGYLNSHTRSKKNNLAKSVLKTTYNCLNRH